MRPQENRAPMTPGNLNQRTAALAAAGLVSIAFCISAEESQTSGALNPVTSSTLSGYVDTSAIWLMGTGQKLYGRSFDQGSNSAPGQNKQDGFNLNVASLTLEKTLDDGRWASGYQ